MVTQVPDGSVVFRFYRPDVSQMTIAGDFNGWQHSFHMTRERDGWWHCQVELTPGTYRFRYKGDDQWFTDYAAFGVEPCPFGWNSVLKVEVPVVVTEREPTFDLHETMAMTASTSASQSKEMATSQSSVESGFLSASDRPARRLRRQPALVG